MSAWDSCRKVEAQSMRVLQPFLSARYDGQIVLNEKGRLAKELQAKYGDLFATHPNGGVIAVEVKAEQKNAYKNFFLEEWSNRSRFNHGWMHKLEADVLLYHFVDDDELYAIDFQRLKKWAFWCENGQWPRLYDFKMRRQAKYEQRNDTWGVAVPISVIKSEVGFRMFYPKKLLLSGAA